MPIGQYSVYFKAVHCTISGHSVVTTEQTGEGGGDQGARTQWGDAAHKNLG